MSDKMRLSLVVVSQIVELSKWTAWPGPPRVGHLVDQPNPAHLLVSRTNLNSTWLITDWWINGLAH